MAFLKSTGYYSLVVNDNGEVRTYGHVRPMQTTRMIQVLLHIVGETFTPMTLTYLMKVRLMTWMEHGVTGQYKKENQTCS